VVFYTGGAGKTSRGLRVTEGSVNEYKTKGKKPTLEEAVAGGWEIAINAKTFAAVAEGTTSSGTAVVSMLV